MERYIKYTRIVKKVNNDSIIDLFDNLISNGWEIIYYREDSKEIYLDNNFEFNVLIVAGKRQNSVL